MDAFTDECLSVYGVWGFFFPGRHQRMRLGLCVGTGKAKGEEGFGGNDLRHRRKLHCTR